MLVVLGLKKMGIILFLFFVIAKEWKPRYGYKRANDDTKDWLLEVPANAGDIFIIYPSWKQPYFDLKLL